ncbi:sce7726 family protein [Hymenobacter sp. 15J16-1T3B]|uniref:sce7726 family protein n=1 Tax=Hymenobacter sp. 15J16-1T3B TaxID=2886941 RepID=UPI001D0FD118|nr:sce7726 family protein [Hymenobacter sp. 15J16-1T3B]MCC3159174.1 sce7726 family protein [Hymenobacter sp. 15J16-1T3B]
MNDPEIRALLYPLLQGGVYVDELPTGTTRADVVHITAQFMHGYELKSDGDTLQRVKDQLPCYARAYDFVTFVVTEKHLAKLLDAVPEWVGVLVASADGLREHRPARYNATVERGAVAGLLRLSEVKQYLMDHGLHHVSLLRRRDVSKLLNGTQVIPLSHLCQFVRDRLIARMPQRLENREVRKAERATKKRLKARGRKPTGGAKGKPVHTPTSKAKASPTTRKSAAR